MKYANVYIEAIGYELAPVVVTSAELEGRLAGLYQKLNIAPGQLEALSGIHERRWWEPGYPLSQGAMAAGRKALQSAGVKPADLGSLVYAGVCREQFEPATACRVAAGLGVGGKTTVYDLSNACLGVLNGMLDTANRIALGQIRAGLVVSCESAREINDITINRMLAQPSMGLFASSLATLTGGSGGVAVLLTDGSFTGSGRRRLLGGVTETAPEHHALCRWGINPDGRGGFNQYMATDAVAVMKHGVELGARTWQAFLREMEWAGTDVDRVICHQVGSGHQSSILKTLNIPKEQDFTTYEYLGNIGTVSLPITAALAEEREFLLPGDRVGLLGIGSGLNCLMLGVSW
jgi:3-oxoacyl-[acyl-carrier-protein] synthase-3